MSRITINDKDLELLVPRYKAISGLVTDLAFEVNQMINRLEPAVLTSDNIDVRIVSIVRRLEKSAEAIRILISQINITIEKFNNVNRNLIIELNKLIYELKEMFHQKENIKFYVFPNPRAIEDKNTIDKMFEAKAQIESVKLGYIDDVVGKKGG